MWNLENSIDELICKEEIKTDVENNMTTTRGIRKVG